MQRTDVDEEVGAAEEREELVGGGGEDAGLDDHLSLMECVLWEGD